jgi:hypothetical protein
MVTENQEYLSMIKKQEEYFADLYSNTMKKMWTLNKAADDKLGIDRYDFSTIPHPGLDKLTNFPPQEAYGKDQVEAEAKEKGEVLDLPEDSGLWFYVYESEYHRLYIDSDKSIRKKRNFVFIRNKKISLENLEDKIIEELETYKEDLSKLKEIVKKELYMEIRGKGFRGDISAENFIAGGEGNFWRAFHTYAKNKLTWEY